MDNASRLSIRLYNQDGESQVQSRYGNIGVNDGKRVERSCSVQSFDYVRSVVKQ